MLRTETSSSVRTQIGVGGFTVSERAKALVMSVLDSNRLTAGPMMTRFEREVARRHGCGFGLMCNSGTSALHIALAALKETRGWRDGDEVLVPAITFVATSNVVLHCNLRPVFVDVDPTYYTIDPCEIERRITSRTRAIIPVHVGGLAADMDPIVDIARDHDLAIVEDACEAMFAKYRDRPVGSFGEVGCFSTYAAHLITTGVGGVCTTSDPDLLITLKSLMNHGRDSIYIRIDDDQRAYGADLFRIADRRFSFVRIGHSFRATEMEAALGVAQLEESDELCAIRAAHALRMTHALHRLEGRLQLPRSRPDAEHVFMFYPLVILDERVSRDDLVLFLEQRGVETRYLLPLINQPVYRALFGDLDAEYPVAARLNRAALYVGCHPEMTSEDADYIAASLIEYFEARG